MFVGTSDYILTSCFCALTFLGAENARVVIVAMKNASEQYFAGMSVKNLAIFRMVASHATAHVRSNAATQPAQRDARSR
jgi:hypothetical protein